MSAVITVLTKDDSLKGLTKKEINELLLKDKQEFRVRLVYDQETATYYLPQLDYVVDRLIKKGVVVQRGSYYKLIRKFYQ